MDDSFEHKNEWNFAYGFIFQEMRKCYSFLIKFSSKFCAMEMYDKLELLALSCHKVRLARMIFTNHQNYFNCDENKFSSICKNCFPIFSEIQKEFEETAFFIRSLNFDQVERALFASLCAFSISKLQTF